MIFCSKIFKFFLISLTLCSAVHAQLTIHVEGHADVSVPCEIGDWSCQARHVCEAVTGQTCVWQSYDCATGSAGSWYPNDGVSGGSNFNFAYAYDFHSGGNYGNICACDLNISQTYGVANNHQYCGIGVWYRDGGGPSCGNGTVDAGELCDDGNITNGDGCNFKCQNETGYCGDGVTNPGEDCDNYGGNYNGCTSSCQYEIVSCGNGTLDSGEQCDDGNRIPGDGCGYSCQIEFCGDYICNNSENNSSCSQDCALCGNSSVEIGESCDDGNTNSSDGCSSSCQNECGNGSIDSSEQCDDGNSNNGDGCNSSCQYECGNNSVDSGEQCDDGNTNSGDGCNSSCQYENNYYYNAYDDNEYISPYGSTAIYFGNNDSFTGSINPSSTYIYSPYGSANNNYGSYLQTSGGYLFMYGDYIYYYNTSGSSDNFYYTACNYEGSCSTAYIYINIAGPACGNSSVESGEQCDDGNTNNGDGCNSSCQYEYYSYCGNYSVDPGEQCDDGNTNNGDGCDSSCQYEYYSYCGNYSIDSGEQCDDGNTNNGDGCNSSCQYEYYSYCGNYSVDSGEQCDDGNTNNGDGCNSSCQSESYCGNNSIDSGEQCDDGNTNSGDGCSSSCQSESVGSCGNSIIEIGESCDDGNTNDGDSCSSQCYTEGLSLTLHVEGHCDVVVPCAIGDWSCQAHYACNQITGTQCVWQAYDCVTGNSGSWYPNDGQSGSSNFNFAYAYDLGYGAHGNICAASNPNQLSVYGLGTIGSGFTAGLFYRDGAGTTSSSCSSICGNGSIESGEQCDDNNTSDFDGCSATCQTETPVCGNGHIESGEQCDDENYNSGDGCYNCLTEYIGYCGNGTVDYYEQCDDSNTSDFDGCSATCQTETPVCGNGHIESGEQCDDSGTSDYDGCSSTCQTETPVCGNGHIESGEQCDDSNLVNFDGCSSTCQTETPVCGNGHPESGEQCDDSNLVNFDGCSSTCQTETPVCGNGHIESGEQCDDSNLVNFDGCSSACQNQPPVCGNGHIESGEQCDDNNRVNFDGCSETCMIQAPTITETKLTSFQIEMQRFAYKIIILGKRSLELASSSSCRNISRNRVRILSKIGERRYKKLVAKIWADLPGATYSSNNPLSCTILDHKNTLNDIRKLADEIYSIYQVKPVFCQSSRGNRLLNLKIKTMENATTNSYRTLEELISGFPETTTKCNNDL